MGEYYVYIHKNTVNGKIYVGITRQTPSRRWRNGAGYYQNQHFTRAINKYGWEAFEHIIYADSLEKDDACKVEKELISLFKSNEEEHGYNKSTGGEYPAEGFHHSEETKKMIGERSRNFKHSEKTKQILREKAIKRLSEYNPKIGLIGEKCPTAKKIVQIRRSGEVVRTYNGTYEACRECGFKSPSKIGDVCKGTRKTAYGYIWKYAGGS